MENEKNLLNQRNLYDSQTRNQMQPNSLKRSGSQGGLRKLQLNGNFPNHLLSDIIFLIFKNTPIS